jgi:cytochrome c
MRSVAAHRTSITALAASGPVIASGGSDGAYATWDAASLGQIHRWQTVSAVRGVALSSDGTRLASAHASGRVRITRLDDPAHGFTSFHGHRGAADTVAFFPDGRLVSGGADAQVQVWDAHGARLLTINAEGPLTAVTVSPDGRWIAGNTSDRVAIVWDATDGSVASPGWERSAATARSLAFDSASHRLVASLFNGPVEVWDPFTGSSPLQLVGHTRPIPRAVFAGSDDLIASAGQDALVNVWDAQSGRCLSSLYTGDTLVQSMVWLGGSRFCLSGTGHLATWDLTVLDERIRALARDLLRDRRALPAADGARLAVWAATPDAPVCRP